MYTYLIESMSSQSRLTVDARLFAVPVVPTRMKNFHESTMNYAHTFIGRRVVRQRFFLTQQYCKSAAFVFATKRVESLVLPKSIKTSLKPFYEPAQPSLCRSWSDTKTRSTVL